MTAPCELSHRLIGGMTRRGYGRVLNVASVAGLMPGSANQLFKKDIGDAECGPCFPSSLAEGFLQPIRPLRENNTRPSCAMPS